MIERQMFVTWYTPKEKLPKEGEIVIATISGKGKNIPTTTLLPLPSDIRMMVLRSPISTWMNSRCTHGVTCNRTGGDL